MAKKLVQDGSCPVATTISLLNSQWKILIMRELLLHPSERYSVALPASAKRCLPKACMRWRLMESCSAKFFQKYRHVLSIV